MNYFFANIVITKRLKICEQAQDKIYFNAESVYVTIKLCINSKSCTTFSTERLPYLSVLEVCRQ